MNVPGLGETSLRRVIQAVRELAEGGTNAAGRFALTAGETRTIVENRRCADASLPVLVPFSVSAGAVGAWVVSVERGRFTVGHAVAPAGAVFRYELRQP